MSVSLVFVNPGVAGLVPATHVFFQVPAAARRGWPGQARPRRFLRDQEWIDGITAAEPASRRLRLHQGGAAADRDFLAALVQADMLEFDDPGVRARFAAPGCDHFRAGVDR